MGQSRKNSRRGGARWAGTLAPPGSGDWSIGSITQTSMVISWKSPAPLPATKVWLYFFNVTTKTQILSVATALQPIPIDGLAAGNTYLARLSWVISAARDSEWSDTKVAATLP